MHVRSRRAGDDESIRRPLSWIVVAITTAVAVAGVVLAGGATTSAAECDALSVPSVGVERCIFPGRQVEIDAGNAVRVPDLSTSSGHWLAGHRSTHGSTFGPLTQLEIGDVITYRVRQYRIVEYTTALFADPGHVLAWTSTETPTVVLQTSVDSVRAHLWRAEAIPVEEVAATHAASVQRAVADRDELVRRAIAAVFAPATSGSSRLAAMTDAAL